MNNILTIFLLILRLGNGRLLGYVDKVSYSPTLNFHPRVTAKSNSSDYEDHGNRRCFNKVVMVEKMEFDTVETCNHSYQKECHTSYMTKFEPYEEEECKIKYQKSCHIRNVKKPVSMSMEVCRTPMVKVCPDPDNALETREQEKECKTVYEAECWTRYEKHEVEDDIPECETVNETRCDEAGENCESWPREQCSIVTKAVTKTTPKTGCDKVPKRMCMAKRCHLAEGGVECGMEQRSMVVDSPEEECEMSPVRVCRPVTKMVPQLVPTNTCMDVPREMCSQSKINPRRVKRPVIRKVCYKRNDDDASEEDGDEDDNTNDEDTDDNGSIENQDNNDDDDMKPSDDCSECLDNNAICDIENFPYTSCSFCQNNTCVSGCLTDNNCPKDYKCEDGVCRSGPGKVLVHSINVKTAEIGSQAFQDLGIIVSLRGEVIGEFLGGVPCTTNTMSLTRSGQGHVSSWDGKLEDGSDDIEEEKQMGTCFKAPLNAQVKGGTVTLVGGGDLRPVNVCIDWYSSNMAWTCDTIIDSDNTWDLVNCRDLTPIQKCSQFYDN